MKPPPWNKKWWCDDMIGFVFAPIQNIVVLCRWQRSWRWTNERPWPFQRRQKRERGEFLTCVTKILYWGTLQWHQSVEEKTRFSLGSTDQTNAWLHYAAAFRVSHWAAMQSLFERGFAPSFFLCHFTKPIENDDDGGAYNGRCVMNSLAYRTRHGCHINAKSSE